MFIYSIIFILRSVREQELDYFQRKKFGQLSEKVNRRLEKYRNTTRIDPSSSSLSIEQLPPPAETSQ